MLPKRTHIYRVSPAPIFSIQSPPPPEYLSRITALKVIHEIHESLLKITKQRQLVQLLNITETANKLKNFRQRLSDEFNIFLDVGKNVSSATVDETLVLKERSSLRGCSMKSTYYWFAETFTTNNPDLIKGLLTQDIERIITILRTAKLFASSDVTAINNAANDRLRKVDIVFALLDRALTDAILARTFQRAIIKFKYVANYNQRAAFGGAAMDINVMEVYPVDASAPLSTSSFSERPSLIPFILEHTLRTPPMSPGILGENVVIGDNGPRGPDHHMCTPRVEEQSAAHCLPCDFCYSRTRGKYLKAYHDDHRVACKHDKFPEQLRRYVSYLYLQDDQGGDLAVTEEWGSSGADGSDVSDEFDFSDMASDFSEGSFEESVDSLDISDVSSLSSSSGDSDMSDLSLDDL
ncbi:hypothetical protein B0H14DRAFT_2617295 [Mycena olivaceomarginata]|nr:hypothetical protein B0H14DRAFT_2617295 [Mycena olivaceomarginata]